MSNVLEALGQCIVSAKARRDTDTDQDPYPEP